MPSNINKRSRNAGQGDDDLPPAKRQARGDQTPGDQACGEQSRGDAAKSKNKRARSPEHDLMPLPVEGATSPDYNPTPLPAEETTNPGYNLMPRHRPKRRRITYFEESADGNFYEVISSSDSKPGSPEPIEAPSEDAHTEHVKQNDGNDHHIIESVEFDSPDQNDTGIEGDPTPPPPRSVESSSDYTSPPRRMPAWYNAYRRLGVAVETRTAHQNDPYNGGDLAQPPSGQTAERSSSYYSEHASTRETPGEPNDDSLSYPEDSFEEAPTDCNDEVAQNNESNQYPPTEVNDDRSTIDGSYAYARAGDDGGLIFEGVCDHAPIGQNNALRAAAPYQESSGDDAYKQSTPEFLTNHPPNPHSSEFDLPQPTQAVDTGPLTKVDVRGMTALQKLQVGVKFAVSGKQAPFNPITKSVQEDLYFKLAKKDPNDVPTTVEGLEQTLDDVYNFNPKARTLDKIIGTDEWEGYGEVFNHELAMPYPGDDGPRMADPRLLRQHWARRYLPT